MLFVYSILFSAKQHQAYWRNFMKNVSSLILVMTALVFNFFPSIVEARWATIDDADVVVESYNRTIEVFKNGANNETIEVVAKAVKESGKDSLVSLPLTYNTRNSKLKILEAKTIRDGKEYPVDIKQIEDKPLASSPQGFDQNNQLLIAFPEMALNAKIYIKYQHKVTHPAIPGFYASNFIYGMGQYCESSKVRIVSELPFNMQVNDPEQYLEIKQAKVNNKNTLDITLKRPVFKQPIDEQFAAADPTIYPWVTVSTLKNWPEFGNLLTKRYEAVLNQPLPDLFAKIVEEAAQKSGTIEKINTVTTRIAENITYMGDWRTVEGAYVPRNLALIVKTKLGDCKDLSASTVTILRKLGLKADVALVSRGTEYFRSPNNIPTMEDFNHAFVRVIDGDTIYWIDPTNFTSFAQGIYPDIADRKALVLNAKQPELAQTAGLKPEGSERVIQAKVSFPSQDPDLAKAEGQISIKGVYALPLIGADLRSSKESTNRDIIQMVTDESRTVDWNVQDYNLTSRIVNDLNFSFNFTEKHTKMKTTAGNAFVVYPQSPIYRLLAKTSDRVTDMQLDLPGVYKDEILISKTSLVGELSNCSIDSPWVSGSRQITNTEDGIRVLDNLVVKKDKILNSELKSKEYAEFQNKIYHCFGSTALVYNNSMDSSNVSSSTNSKMDSSITSTMNNGAQGSNTTNIDNSINK